MDKTARIGGAGVLWAATAAATVHARETAAPPERVRVVYTAEEDAACPNAAEFDTAVRERVRYADLATNATTKVAREYRVHVRRVGSRYVARLEFVDARGATRTREVGAETCADAATALALVTALAVDAGGTDADEVTQDADGPLSASEALGLITPSVPSPPAPPVTTANTADPAPGRPAPGTPTSAHLSAGLGVRVTLTSPKGPTLLPGAELFVGLSERRVFHVELGVAGERGFRGQQGPGSARFSFIGARLSGCALPLELGPSVEMMPCVVLEGGATEAEGFIAHPETKVDSWFAVGPAVRFVANFRSGSLDVRAGPLFPTTRNRFTFGPEEPVHDVPLVGVYVAAGGAFRLF